MSLRLPQIIQLQIFLECKYEDFENNFIELSKKTFDNFQEMIPTTLKNYGPMVSKMKITI